MDERKFSPILPFDITVADSFYTYDKTKYTRDIQLCPEESIQINSPNMIKYYRCDNTPPVKIGGDR